MSDGFDRKLSALVYAARRLDEATTLARIAVHELVTADLQGAVDVANRMLYEAIRASETLKAQFRELHEEAIEPATDGSTQIEEA